MYLCGYNINQPDWSKMYCLLIINNEIMYHGYLSNWTTNEFLEPIIWWTPCSNSDSIECTSNESILFWYDWIIPSGSLNYQQKLKHLNKIISMPQLALYIYLHRVK